MHYLHDFIRQVLIQLKTVASVCITFLSFLSPPTVRKHHKIARAVAYSLFRHPIFCIYAQELGRGYRIISSLNLSPLPFPRLHRFPYDHRWWKPESPRQQEFIVLKSAAATEESNLFYKHLSPIKPHTRSLHRNNNVTSLLICKGVNREPSKRFPMPTGQQGNCSAWFQNWSSKRMQGTKGDNKESGSTLNQYLL